MLLLQFVVVALVVALISIRVNGEKPAQASSTSIPPSSVEKLELHEAAKTLKLSSRITINRDVEDSSEPDTAQPAE